MKPVEYYAYVYESYLYVLVVRCQWRWRSLLLVYIRLYIANLSFSLMVYLEVFGVVCKNALFSYKFIWISYLPMCCDFVNRPFFISNRHFEFSHSLCYMRCAILCLISCLNLYLRYVLCLYFYVISRLDILHAY